MRSTGVALRGWPRASRQAGCRHPRRADEAAREHLAATERPAVVVGHGVRSVGAETPPSKYTDTIVGATLSRTGP